MDRALKVGGEFDKRLTALAEKEITPALLTQGGDEDQEGAGRQQRGNGGGESRASG